MFKSWKFSLIVLLVLFFVGFSLSCTMDNGNEILDEEYPEEPIQDLKVAFVIQGGIDWPGWNKGGYDALVKAEEKYGFKASISEMVGFEDMDRVFTEYAEAGYDLVWAHASAFDYGVPEVAEKYPEVKWLITGGRFTGLENVISYDYNWRDSTYLFGFLAAKMTETGIFGMTIGEPFPTVTDLALGAKVGFLKNIENGEYIHNVAATWADPDKGREIALAQIDYGADIVSAWAGSTGDGTGAAADERGVHYIAEGMDRGSMYPNSVIGYAFFSFERPIMEVVEAVLSDHWESGLVLFGITDPDELNFIVTDLVPEGIKAEVEAEKQRLIDAGGVSGLHPDVKEYAIDDVDSWF